MLPDTTTLPNNIQAESALLGALMIDNRLVDDVRFKLAAKHFYDPLHHRIYDKILTLLDRDMIANPITMRPLFAQEQAAYLAELTQDSAALIGAMDFADQIYRLALLRELIQVGRDMVTSAMDVSESVDPNEEISKAELALYQVAEQGGTSNEAKEFKESARLAIDMAERALKSGGHLSGLTTGLESLNARLGGLQASDLLVLAGRPGMGKTALATNIAFSVAKRFLHDKGAEIPEAQSSGAAVAFFSLEMSADQLATRILAEQSNISSENLRMGKITHDDFDRLARVARELQDLPLYIDDSPGLSIAALRTKARRLKRQKKIGLVIVDYLQLLSPSRKGRSDNRVQEVAEITRGLKTLAKELNAPVLALSQLSRAVEQREDKKPHLADLRESGTIEQDADIVLFVYREEYYHTMHKPEDGGRGFEEWLETAHRIEGQAEIIIAKQRHGATGIVPVMFDKSRTKFSDRADSERLPVKYM